MCIVSFVVNDSSFILTFNRDETSVRPALPPAYHHENGLTILSPTDQSKGGTWIGYNGRFAACLQNGAFEKHHRHPPYRMSRGLILKEILNETLSVETFNETMFEGIEPFTMSIYNPKENTLKIYRYDAEHLHLQTIAPLQQTIICSATLYDNEARTVIRSQFEALTGLSPDDLFEFNKTHRIGEPLNHFTNLVPTVSITQLHITGREVHSRYLDCITGEEWII